ncbi:UPF0489 protein C5orf22 homolog [Coccinella septempunctata]|uniref:UPF0489 protein C5orf22 homolog n=1 Tax=Coccinella septempunctata TaxID=41139 RepID=UPI001D074DCD|nr:UPF0489 protein C5orf22 homolog [Coccinella septempunctata]
MADRNIGEPITPTEEQLPEFEELQEFEPPEEAVANVIEYVQSVAIPGGSEGENPQFNGHNFQSARQSKQIPICIVNENQDIIEFVHDMINKKFFPEHGSTLIHVDANPDLLAPNTMPADESFDHSMLYLQHNYDRWILPNCYNGIFKKIIWVRPPWSEHIREDSVTFKVGKHKESSYINVDCKQNYFIAECLWTTSDNLTDAKNITLDCITLGNELSYENDCPEYWRAVLGENQTVPTVLDIDLEFFITENPYLFLYENTIVYELLRELFVFIRPTSQTDEAVTETVEMRSEQFKEIETYFNHLTQHHKLPDPEDIPPSPIYEKVAEIMAELERHGHDLKDVDWDLLYDCGHSFGDHEHPHHVTNSAELDLLFKSFENFLDEFYEPPSIITIARSDLEGYAEIEDRLLELLNSKFNCAVPIVYDQGNAVGVDSDSTCVSEDVDERGTDELEEFLEFLTLQTGEVDNSDASNANLALPEGQDDEEDVSEL